MSLQAKLPGYAVWTNKKTVFPQIEKRNSFSWFPQYLEQLNTRTMEHQHSRKFSTFELHLIFGFNIWMEWIKHCFLKRRNISEETTSTFFYFEESFWQKCTFNIYICKFCKCLIMLTYASILPRWFSAFFLWMNSMRTRLFLKTLPLTFMYSSWYL